MLPKRATIDDAAEEFRSLLSSSIERKIGYGSGPSTTFLSGGVDSAAIMAETVALDREAAALTLTNSAIPRLAVNHRYARLVSNRLGVARHFDVDTCHIAESPQAFFDDLVTPPLLSTRDLSRAEFSWAADELISNQGTGHPWRTLLTGHGAEALLVHDAETIVLAQGVRMAHPLESHLSLGETLNVFVKRLRRRICRQQYNSIPWLTPPFWSRDRLGEWMTDAALECAYEGAAKAARERSPCSSHLAPSARLLCTAMDSLIDDDGSSIEMNHIWLPRGLIRFDPFIDRDLLEFCLALPESWRVAFADDLLVDKLLIRYAYHFNLGKRVASSTTQLAEDITFERIAKMQRSALNQMFGSGSMLADLGIIRPARFLEIVSQPSAPQHRPHAPYLLMAATVELWLRRQLFRDGSSYKSGWETHPSHLVEPESNLR
jgi:asparagine synthetase B (glutamine-hydrolysing)